MQDIQTILLTAFLSIVTALVGVAVQSVKKYLIAKGGEKAVKIVEILAKNAVNAVEQIAAENGWKGADKLQAAKVAVSDELSKHNIYMTDKQLDVFIEAAVKQMHDNWRGGHHGN
ncbi:phage holin [Streptococcus sp. E17BB]|uniref:phage holin n=1 Tax=Streptococcus sp. E17BB TaxID=3278714 RepID=UPI00359E92B9